MLQNFKKFTKFHNLLFSLPTEVKTPFQKDKYKYLTKSIFGKTMGNAEKRINIKLKTHSLNLPGSIGAETLIRRANCKSSVFNENLVAIQM